MATDGKDKTALTEKIAELEALLVAQRGTSARIDNPSPQGESGVPILDELISGDDNDEYPELPFDDEPDLLLEQTAGELDPRLDQIADELEQKLTKELDEIVNLLKTNMRESILNELQTMLHNETDKKTDS